MLNLPVARQIQEQTDSLKVSLNRRQELDDARLRLSPGFKSLRQLFGVGAVPPERS